VLKHVSAYVKVEGLSLEISTLHAGCPLNTGVGCESRAFVGEWPRSVLGPRKQNEGNRFYRTTVCCYV